MNKKPSKRKYLSEEREYSKHDKIAHIITVLTISPFQIATYLLLAGLIAPIWIYPVENILLNIISSIFFLGIPTIPLIYLKKRARLEGNQISREDRYILFLILIPNYLILIFIYNAYCLSVDLIPTPLLNFTISYLFVLFVEFIVTCIFKFKTSMHVSGAACSIISLSFNYGPFILFLLLFIIPIAWARWRIKGHSIPQLVSGWTIGIFTALICHVLLLM
jgi:hypothetical protein